MLQIVDAQWKDHLYSLDHLKEGIGLRGYGQRDPLVEYKRESFDALPGHEGARRRGDGPLSVVAAPRADRGRAAAPRPPRRARAAPRPPLILNDPAAEPQRSRAARTRRRRRPLRPSPFGAVADRSRPRVGGDDATSRR